MSKTSWRDEWTPFRLALVDETARCVAEQLSTDADGHQPTWETLSRRKQVELTEHVASIFLAQERAMHRLAERGVPF